MILRLVVFEVCRDVILTKLRFSLRNVRFHTNIEMKAPGLVFCRTKGRILRNGAEISGNRTFKGGGDGYGKPRGWVVGVPCYPLSGRC